MTLLSTRRDAAMQSAASDPFSINHDKHNSKHKLVVANALQRASFAVVILRQQYPLLEAGNLFCLEKVNDRSSFSKHWRSRD